MLRRQHVIGWLTLTLVIAGPLALWGADGEIQEPKTPIARLEVQSARIDWLPHVDYESLVLTVSGPADLYLRYEFGSGQTPHLGLIDPKGAPLPDGNYTYELRAFSRETRVQLSRAREPRGGSNGEGLQGEEGRSVRPLVQSGYFFIKDGSFAQPQKRTSGKTPKPPLRSVTASLVDDDLVIQGNACIGSSCATNGNDYSTLKLNAIQPNILFDDVEPIGFSSSSSNDWALLINPFDVGQFSIADFESQLVPFSVMGGAPDNSLLISGNGNVGLGTATPAAHLEVSGGEVRFPPGAGGAGFTHFNFVGDGKNYIRGTTIIADNAGSVGIGTTSPSTKLHVSGSAGTTKALVEETSSTTAARELLEIRNNGNAVLIIKDATLPERWTLTGGGNFLINNQNNPGFEYTFGNTGNLTAAGSMTATAFIVSSDRNLKKAIVPVRSQDVLAKLASIPISTWTFKNEDIRHLGPMAQDFAAAFGLGSDDTHISVTDMAGVSMAAVQALNEVVQQKNKEIADLKSRLETLENLVQRLTETEPQQ